MADSDGGVIIYGIAEGKGKQKHLPAKFDPVLRNDFSKERLEQIIQTIRPLINGMKIHPVTISDDENTVCCVVEIPKSTTAHMARDHRYHLRQNFTTVAMEDFQVREAMHRGKNRKFHSPSGQQRST